MLTRFFSGRIIVNKSTNIYLNLAKELEMLYSPPKDENILYLWRNNPVVVIGKHQNPYKECNLPFMKAKNIVLSRRPTGGGAVYQDLGNTCWSFLSPKFDPEYNNKIIIDSLSTLGIKATATGRNDIEVNGKKVSGSAFRKAQNRSIHHGTMIMNVNMEHLVESLTVDTSKLIAKGVESVRSRVMNLNEANKLVNHDAFCDSIIKSFKLIHADAKVEEVNEDSLLNESEVRLRYNELSSHDWIYGKASKAMVSTSTRYQWGGFELGLTIENGRVTKCIVHSDCLYTDLVESLENSINFYIKNNLASVTEVLNKEFTKYGDDPLKSMSKELKQWVHLELSKYSIQ